MAIEAMLPGVQCEDDPRVRWFRPFGCVQRRDDGVREVFVGGVLVGTYEAPAERNVLLVKLAEEPRTRMGELSEAFGVSSEVVRRARRTYETGGIAAVVKLGKPGRPDKTTPEVRRRAWESFGRGHKVAATAKAMRKQVSYGTVWRLHQEWKAEQAAPQAPVEHAAQCVLELERPGNDTTAEPEVAALQGPQVVDSGAAQAEESELDEPALATEFDRAASEMSIEEAVKQGGRHVQHAGAWIVLAMLHAMGVYRYAARLSGRAVSLVALRVALDAVALSLTIGQRCIEGVRRLATPSAPTLLRTAAGVSASWTRDVMHRFADAGGVLFHLAVARDLMSEGLDDAGRVVMYVDNHLRRYTGKHTLRKGWRMQDRRAVQGTTDYYLHDITGQPLMRVDVPSHDSLSRWLSPIAELCRRELGKDSTVLLAFDRGGAFAEQLADVRNRGFEFVTYERAPYSLLSPAAFDHALELEIDGKREAIRWTEQAHKNLREGRGRVRRISLLMGDGSQINLLAIAKLSAETLIDIQLHRWRQENGFKHGVERWGINQLDSRKVEPTPGDEIIPNPARRLLDHRLRFARAEEGRARNALARLGDDDPRRGKHEQDLERALRTQAEIEAQRPHVPERAPVKDTPLAGKLVRHLGRYKTAIDTLRVALANIESELAGHLAPELPRAAEAKKTLANLFQSPGHVRLTAGKIHVNLMPAATGPERDAIDGFLRKLDRLDLSLPGDPEHRVLRFRAQQL